VFSFVQVALPPRVKSSKSKKRNRWNETSTAEPVVNPDGSKIVVHGFAEVSQHITSTHAQGTDPKVALGV